ncbi:UDP-glucose 4-epimerase GalE [Subtercola boreus]|uniref:UDP-glucose 4-epimerase n=1 Tax=Subtercola boreus TaxID=120213 RepID=A0A3E0W693_9MICO|nr:UDP-glucose 4-epimerase GalE [Subtercola boreus]RFA17914.1 UDP-glucose 4-epimerase GalE [Subtercola boreus]RFA18296.1 UDP-glucose 4-epimerase GalE [Subtercola boreus]RFA24826.1 UDP-glucose 4-epimerase GalE [Subtercola boreus]
MTWLVTGGAGYIGSHVARAFLDAGIEVVVIDDLSSGRASFVPDGATLKQGSLVDRAFVDSVFAGYAGSEHPITGVVHLAGYKYAGVSVQRPLHTYTQNVTATVNLLEAMHETGVGSIVFSSSAAVYGNTPAEFVTEETATSPESPYGETKLIGEWLIADQAVATGLRHTALRYFNVVGSALPEVSDTSPHNLFPLVFRALQNGQTPKIFGDQYPTPDGTCVRDYVHVADVAAAHVAAARTLDAGHPLDAAYNLGSGSGVSVREIMTSMAEVTGIPFTPEVFPPRPGDPARIVASGERAARDVDWAPAHTLTDMIASGWAAATRSV